MLAFQAEVVYVDGTWRFEVASFPSPHLVMTRAELFLSRHEFSYNVRTNSAGRDNAQLFFQSSASERSWVGEGG